MRLLRLLNFLVIGFTIITIVGENKKENINILDTKYSHYLSRYI